MRPGFIWPLHCRQCRYPIPAFVVLATKVHFDVRFPCMRPISAADFPFLNSLCFQRRPHWMNSVAGRGDTFQRKVGCMSWVVGSDDKLLISQVLEMEACNTRGLYSKPRLWHEFYLSFRVPLHNRSYISFSAAKVSQHVWVCAMLAATPNKQRWTNWMMGVFLSRLLVFMGATAEVVSHCWTCFLSICVSVFLTCFLFCACAGVCVCAFVFSWVSCKVFHDIPAHFSCNCDRTAWEHNYRELRRNTFKKVAMARPHRCGRKAVAYKILRGKNHNLSKQSQDLWLWMFLMYFRIGLVPVFGECFSLFPCVCPSGQPVSCTRNISKFKHIPDSIRLEISKHVNSSVNSRYHVLWHHVPNMLIFSTGRNFAECCVPHLIFDIYVFDD